jgi:uracil-DNA glycosylase
LKPILILAFGNTSLLALTGKDSGITEKSGQTEWIESIGAWVCWCVHPSYVLRNREKNLKLFRDSLQNFADKIEILGGLK